MKLLLGDAIISLGFDKMSTVICTEHKHILRHHGAFRNLSRGKLKLCVWGLPFGFRPLSLDVCLCLDY